jgi:hypothetical protein
MTKLLNFNSNNISNILTIIKWIINVKIFKIFILNSIFLNDQKFKEEITKELKILWAGL